MGPVHWEFEAIGTQWEIDALLPQETAGAVRDRVLMRIVEFDKNYSRFRDDSLVSEIAQRPGRYEMPDDWQLMWELYARLYVETNGAINPLVGEVLEKIGYDKEYSFVMRGAKPALPLDTVHFDAPFLTVLAPVCIDVGAAGKGHIVDIIAGLLREEGAREYVVDAGGDIACAGESMRVALEDPQDATLAVGVIELRDESICASAGNRRAWGKYHHILDPRTVESPSRVIATWVVAKKTLLADGLATALFFVEPASLANHTFDWAIMYDDRSVRFSSRFSETFAD